MQAAQAFGRISAFVEGIWIGFKATGSAQHSVDAVQRLLHTLKGEARMSGVTPVSTVMMALLSG